MKKINNKKGKVLVKMKKKKEESLDLNSNKLRLIKVSKILPILVSAIPRAAECCTIQKELLSVSRKKVFSSL